jgi:HD-like signal output (HDOD) protein
MISISAEILRTLRRADDLAMFPRVATRIREVVDNPETSLVDLEAAVSMDTTLSAQVLKLANSAFFGLPRSVASLKQALLILGFQATRDTTLAIATMSIGRGEDPTRLHIWQRSLRAAATAQLFSSKIGWAGPEAFVAGMLHDIGTLILLELHPYLYEDILHFANSPSHLIETECTTFSFDHAQLGAAALERWHLPERTVNAVLRHHDIESAATITSANLPAALIWISAELARLTVGKDRVPPQVAADTLSVHRIAGILRLSNDELYRAAKSPTPELSP